MTAAQAVSQPPLNLPPKHGNAGGTSVDTCFPNCIMWAHVLSCSTKYFVACFSFSASTIASTSLIFWSQACFLVGGGTSSWRLSKVSERFLQLRNSCTRVNAHKYVIFQVAYATQNFQTQSKFTVYKHIYRQFFVLSTSVGLAHACPNKSVPCYSRLINRCLAPPLRVKFFKKPQTLNSKAFYTSDNTKPWSLLQAYQY